MTLTRIQTVDAVPRGQDELLLLLFAAEADRFEADLATLREAAIAVLSRYAAFGGGCMCDVIDNLRIAAKIEPQPLKVSDDV